VGVLPQPFTTATLVQNSSLAAPIDLSDVWEKYAGDTGSLYVMGATIVRSEFAEQHPQAVADFLSRHAASVQKCTDDVAGTAALVVQAGIVAKEPIAEKAIPQCNIVCMTGDEMKDGLTGYLQVLYDADASSVGGALPEDDFYYNA
jgi:NitT/TauT family transport system substrate-binding protein